MAELALAPLSAPIEVTSGGATIVAEATGAGPPIVLLHAGVADRRSWRPLAPYLAEDHRLVAYDRRGFGDTTGPPEPFDHVADLVAVLDHLDLDRTVLVGNSMGGRVALHAARTHPDRVAGLVLVAANHGADGMQWEEVRWPATLRALGDEMDRVDDLDDLGAMNEVEAWLWLDGHAERGRVTGPARALFLDMNGRALAAADPGEEQQHPAPWDHLDELRVPVHVVEAARDLPWAAAVGRAAAARIEDARFTLLDDVAHVPALERPDALADVVRELVARASV